MSSYKHLLVALDLSEESTEVLLKAKTMASLYNAKLSAIHIVEPLAFAYGGDVPLDMSEAQKTIEEQATKRLRSLLDSNGLSDTAAYINVGQTSTEIHAQAKEINSDLIVVGSHGRHGLALIFGSTANGVLHGAEIDVLAIRV
ncbi:universal stress protein [Agaribacterium haliotis]|uniref:universal stress protein n=1 Tax=Agaribacterium haliotis TaxID=2013869 RepID=UPI000BB55575|nr:universal stress protein [Agaribacterium haliotis]